MMIKYAHIEGGLPSGESTLAIWRDCEKTDYETLKRYGNRFDLEGENNPFDLIYINGDCTMPAYPCPDRRTGRADDLNKIAF